MRKKKSMDTNNIRHKLADSQAVLQLESYAEKLKRASWGNMGSELRGNSSRQVHTAICKHFFEECVDSGQEVYICFEEGLSTHEWFKNERPSVTLRASVLTEDMTQYDQITFGALEELRGSSQPLEWIMENVGYRPYFIEFVFDMENVQGEPNIPSGGWIKAILSSTDELEERNENRRAEGEMFHILGLISQSASPFEISRRTIKLIATKALQKDEIKKINQAYKKLEDRISKAKKIPDLLQKSCVLDMMEPETATCYAVGFANCILVEGKNTSHGTPESFLYDIGIDYRTKDQLIKARSFISEAATFDPQMVILSHWDADHVFGCAYASDAVFRAHWVVPNYPALGLTNVTAMGSRRVACYLECLKRLEPVNDPGNCIFPPQTGYTGSSRISLYQGDIRPRTDGNITKQNKYGLVLSFDKALPAHGTPRLALMCGDVPYASLPASCKNNLNDYRFLVIPHHCCEMDLSSWGGTSVQRHLAVACTRHTFDEYLCFECQAKSPIQSTNSLQSIRQQRMFYGGTQPCCSPGMKPHVSLSEKRPVQTSPEHIRELGNRGFDIFPTGQAQRAMTLDFASNVILIS